MAPTTEPCTTPPWRVKNGPPVLQLAALSSPTPSWRNRGTSTSSSSSSTSSISSSPPRGTNSAAWASTNNWRSGSPPKASPPKAKGTPDFLDLAEGQILFLPAYGVPQNSILWNYTKGGSNPLGHPVVVVGKFKDAKGGEYVQFRNLTSFGGMSLEERKPEHLRHFFIPCESAEGSSSGQGVQTATLEAGSGALAKRSYVNLSPTSIYKIEYTYLEVFKGQPLLRFDTASTHYIKSRV